MILLILNTASFSLSNHIFFFWSQSEMWPGHCRLLYHFSIKTRRMCSYGEHICTEMYWHSYMQRNTFISWIYECLMQTFFKQNTCGLNTAKQNNAMQCAWYKIYYNLFTLWWKLRADVLKVPTHQLNLSPPTINHFISTKDGNVKVNKTFWFFLVLEILGLWISSIWNKHEVTTHISWPNYIKVLRCKQN